GGVRGTPPVTPPLGGAPGGARLSGPRGCTGPRRGGGRGDKGDQRDAVSVVTGLMPKHHPWVPPPPAAAPRVRRKRPTTRPAREPCLAGRPCRGGEPVEL